MPDLLRPLAGPVRPRQDVVSAILNDYSDFWYDEDESGAPLPVERLPSPPPKSDKPHPPRSTSFRPYFDDAGTRNAKRDAPGESRQETTASTAPQPFFPSADAVHPVDAKHPSGHQQASSINKSPQTYPPPRVSLSHRPLPRLPSLSEPDRVQSHDPGPEMGNNPSKVVGDGDGNGSEESRSGSRNPFQRRQVPPSSTLDATTYNLPKPVAEPSPIDNVKIPSSQSERSSPPTLLSTSQSTVTRSTYESETSTIQTTIDRSGSPNSRPATPDTKPLLPPPSPVPEESPSKYGIGRVGDIDDGFDLDRAGHQRTHFRGKSSTGFDIFKSTTARHAGPGFSESIPESDSTPGRQKPTLGLPSNPKASRLNMPILQHHSPSESGSDPKQTAFNTNSVTASYTPLSPSDDSRRSHATSSQTMSSGLASLPAILSPPSRPPNVPPIYITHLRCYHQHARFHLSRNTCAPTPCMLCCSDRTDDRWTCTWCALRICAPCKGKLESSPGRNIEMLIQGGSGSTNTMIRPGTGPYGR